MQPKLCSRCHKNVAVVFITRLDVLATVTTVIHVPSSYF